MVRLARSHESGAPGHMDAAFMLDERATGLKPTALVRRRPKLGCLGPSKGKASKGPCFPLVRARPCRQTSSVRRRSEDEVVAAGRAAPPGPRAVPHPLRGNER